MGVTRSTATMIHAGYHPRKVFLEFSQLGVVIGQNGIGAESLYSLRVLGNHRFELTLVLVILYSLVRQCLQIGSRWTFVHPLDSETLLACSIRPPAQSICIAVFLTRSVLNPARKLGQDLEPPGDLAGRFCSLAQSMRCGPYIAKTSCRTDKVGSAYRFDYCQQFLSGSAVISFSE